MKHEGYYVGGTLYAKAIILLMTRSLSAVELQEVTEFHHGTVWRFIRSLRAVAAPDGTRKPCMFIERWEGEGRRKLACYRLGYATEDAPRPKQTKETKLRQNRESYHRRRKLKLTTTEESQ